MQISFGSNEGVSNPGSNNLNNEAILGMMQEALAANNENLINRINEVEDNFGSQAVQLKAANSANNQFANYKFDQDVLEQYVSQIKLENRDIILSLMEVSGRDQKQYMDELMTDFANFVASQRQEDLDVIQGHINSLVDNSNINPSDDYRASEE